MGTHEPVPVAVPAVTYEYTGPRSAALVYPLMDDELSPVTESTYRIRRGASVIGELWLARFPGAAEATMDDLRYDIAYPDRLLGGGDPRQPDSRTIEGIVVLYVYGSAEGVSLNGMAAPHDRYSWHQGDLLGGVWMADASSREQVCEFVQAYVERAA